MEMGKLTARLRDAVPVCLLVEGKEVKRYNDFEIPDELKKLEYQDFKFDVPMSGAITFKIMFESGVLPEEWPLPRERRTQKPLTQEAQLLDTTPAEDVAAEVEPQPDETKTQKEQPTEAVSPSVMEAFAQALEDAQAAGEPVAEIIKGEDAEELIVITPEPEVTESLTEPVEEAEATAEAIQPKDGEPAKKPARRGKGNKGTAATKDESKYVKLKIRHSAGFFVFIDR